MIDPEKVLTPESVAAIKKRRASIGPYDMLPSAPKSLYLARTAAEVNAARAALAKARGRPAFAIGVLIVELIRNGETLLGLIAKKGRHFLTKSEVVMEERALDLFMEAAAKPSRFYPGQIVQQTAGTAKATARARADFTTPLDGKVVSVDDNWVRVQWNDRRFPESVSPTGLELSKKTPFAISTNKKAAAKGKKAAREKKAAAKTREDNGALQRVDRVLELMTKPGLPLMDPDRTPDKQALVLALKELLKVAKDLPTKAARNRVRKALSDHLKDARLHAKRMTQKFGAATDEVSDARNIRDLLDQGRGLIAKM